MRGLVVPVDLEATPHHKNKQNCELRAFDELSRAFNELFVMTDNFRERVGRNRLSSTRGSTLASFSISLKLSMT